MLDIFVIRSGSKVVFSFEVVFYLAGKAFVFRFCLGFRWVVLYSVRVACTVFCG